MRPTRSEAKQDQNDTINTIIGLEWPLPGKGIGNNDLQHWPRETEKGVLRALQGDGLPHALETPNSQKALSEALF